MELQVIQNKIYEIRSQRVMLDVDLAVLYDTETKRLREAVRRNIAPEYSRALGANRGTSVCAGNDTPNW